MLECEEGDRFSYDDSERFEDESECSWLSEPESLCNNWRDWKKSGNGNNAGPSFIPSLGPSKLEDGSIKSLAELCARTVAAHIPFEVVEQMMPVVPEQIQLWIAYWSFPDNEEDIRLYSCLANGNAEEFMKGENLYRHNCVDEVLQIGFHLSAAVSMLNGSKGKYKVAVAFDRGRITTCNCTCSSNASWCSHVVAVCLHRIDQPKNAKLRAPVSESLSRLQRDQLQKFAQYLISELPQQILPTAQRLIDEILSSHASDINTVSGAPDPTAGASASEQTAWWLDESNLHENIHKILVKFCVPSPMVFSDVNYLSSTAPPVAAEWQSLLRPLRGREPEGMWNLLSIVREMFKRHDHNAIPLLEVITEECLATEKILVWWVNTRVALHSGSSGHGGKNNVNSNSHGSQYACSSLCDEIVILWRLAALNPALSPNERELLRRQFKDWHLKVLEKVAKSKEASSNANSNREGKRGGDIDVFPGFKLASEACLLDWDDYPLPGITYSPAASRYYCPVMCCKHDPNHEAAPISAPLARLPPQFSSHKRTLERRMPGGNKNSSRWGDEVRVGALAAPSNRSQRSSSVSSEGFCDNDVGRDSDSSHEQRSLEQDSGQVSRQSSREDARVVDANVYQDYLRNRNSSNGASNSRVTPPEDHDQGCSMDDTDTDSKRKDKTDEVRECNSNASPQLLPDLAGNRQPASSTSSPNDNGSSSGTLDVFGCLKKLEDPLETLFARAEGLHAHGHVQEASRLAVKLAKELLASPPNLMIDIAIPSTKQKRKRVNPASHTMTLLASATLTKCAFLCTVLAEDPGNTHLAFQVALFGLEMPRPPASTKPLEVKLANQESDLVSLLKRLPLGHMELNVIREKAEQMRTGMHNVRGDSLLPLMLAAFIFDALVASASGRIAAGSQSYRHLVDENLGFDAAVAALGLKANVSEADHPLLCEGTRRQRGDLALTLLTYYKDDQDRLAIIMDKFLDKEVHQMYKTPSLPTYYATKNTEQKGDLGLTLLRYYKEDQSTREKESSTSKTANGSTCYANRNGSNIQCSNESVALDQGIAGSRTLSPPVVPVVPIPSSPCSSTSNWVKNQNIQQTFNVDLPANQTDGVEQIFTRLSLSTSMQPNGGVRPKISNPLRFCENDDEQRDAGIECGPSRLNDASWEDQFKEWEEKVNKHKKKKCQPIAETFPTKHGPGWLKRGGPGSDSGSSGNSSDSIGSFSSGEKQNLEINKPVESPPLGMPIPRPVPHTMPETHPPVRPHPPFGKVIRYKGKRAYPTVPNQPSEASAYFMFELAKTVLSKAGGTSSTSLFKQPPTNTQNHRGPHRALQMCAFQIGVYALGLSNCVTPNWLSRTYSSHVSWISNQATEIGSSALFFLIDTWEGHLTPQEAASIADKASRGRDANTIKEAARLALSCLPHAHALNPNEIQRAIIQCKELSSSMLESACLAVESAAKGGGVYPEVLFSVAQCWYELYETRNRNLSRQGARLRAHPRQLETNEHHRHHHQQMACDGNRGIVTASTNDMSLPPPSLPSTSSPPVVPQHVAIETHMQHPPVSVGVNVTAIHPTSGVPTYPLGTPTSVGYGIPGLSYPLGYNYIQSLPPNVSCINPQLPVQMYIQSQGVPFSGAQGVPSQPLIPPPPMQSLQYYPSVTIPSTLSQTSTNTLPLSGQPNMQLQGTVPAASNMPSSSAPSSLPQSANIIQAPHPGQQGYFSMPYAGPMPPTRFINGAQHHHLLPFVRTPPTSLVQHQPQMQPPPTTQPQQVRGALVGNQVNQQQLETNSGAMTYLLSAYRVGMLAMETLARRVQDDRPQAKYARNPPYGEDVKWLLGVAKKLGTQYLHQFCLCSVNSVVSPFVLYDLAVDAASSLSRISPALYPQHLRSPILQPLIQKCQQMFVQCTHLKMYYITPTDYDEFVSIVRSARSAFQMTPGGMVHFNDLLQALRRSKCCKKELWQRITSALQQPSAV